VVIADGEGLAVCVGVEVGVEVGVGVVVGTVVPDAAETVRRTTRGTEFDPEATTRSMWVPRVTLSLPSPADSTVRAAAGELSVDTVPTTSPTETSAVRA